jgi:5'-nucleotidase/UDP-sugar diphosphatase
MMRSSLFRLFWLFAACALLAACVSVPAPGAPPAPAPTATPQGLAQPKRLTVLYTNDEHGWLAAQKNKDGSSTGGAAEMLGRWREQEGYTPDGPFLVLSGGDMWTGPAISTWFNGDSAAEVMNLMGYQAAAVGNHEFDFGLDVLARHAKDAKFPFLSANLVKKGTTEPPDFVRPYTVVDVDGVKVGIIGLTTRSTPVTTNPKNVAEFSFLPYADALARTVPEVQAAGADVVIALAHVCGLEMRLLAPRAKQLGVDVLTAGHCHERIAEEVAGLPLIGGGQYMQSYARLPLEIDAATRQVTAGKPEVIANRSAANGGAIDPSVAGRVAHWQQQTDDALGEVIGYTKDGLAARSNALLNLITDAWLQAYPTADMAMTNLGGFRQGIDAGPITLDDIVGVLPFNDQIVDAAVTGAQLKENLDCCDSAIAGITYRGGKLLLVDGTPVDPQKTYHVLINDFMAVGGDRYKFDKQDPNAYFTAIDWRQPVIDALKRLGTSEKEPLELHLDAGARTGR